MFDLNFVQNDFLYENGGSSLEGLLLLGCRLCLVCSLHNWYMSYLDSKSICYKKNLGLDIFYFISKVSIQLSFSYP